MTIWKFPIPWRMINGNRIRLKVPKGARPLCIKRKKEQDEFNQGSTDKVCLWCEVSPANPLTEIELIHVETGGEVPENATYLGTCMTHDEQYVSHFYWKSTATTGLMKQ